ncbi:MAG: CheY-P-specific phosphatase CheC [Deltaproteobacteria bacterium RBG_13_65_10]|jgi:chemotaxis protein CheC|nr:MAG: CheY-P-specific phosphatase CheC [Deltaproteobacteria bacterium RBG_13_65_10]
MRLVALSHRQVDALREVSNIGVGHAATALSQLIGRQVSMRVPKVNIIPFSEVPKIVGGAELLVIGIYFQVLGDVTGDILVVFPEDSARALIGLLVNGKFDKNGEWSETAISSLNEIGNILASSYLNALGTLLGVTLIPSVPSLAYDMAGAILDTVLIEQSRVGDLALLIETEFFETKRSLRGHFFLVPDPASLALILDRIGARRG